MPTIKVSDLFTVAPADAVRLDQNVSRLVENFRSVAHFRPCRWGWTIGRQCPKTSWTTNACRQSVAADLGYGAAIELTAWLQHNSRQSTHSWSFLVVKLAPITDRSGQPLGGQFRSAGRTGTQVQADDFALRKSALMGCLRYPIGRKRRITFRFQPDRFDGTFRITLCTTEPSYATAPL